MECNESTEAGSGTAKGVPEAETAACWVGRKAPAAGAGRDTRVRVSWLRSVRQVGWGRVEGAAVEAGWADGGGGWAPEAAAA